MDERLRFKCPCCGMVAYVENLGKHYKIKIFIQEVGGKIAGERKGRGRAKGLIKFIDVTKSRQDIVRIVKKKIESVRE